FASIDFFEQREIPFVVVANRFDGARRHPEAELREALDVDPHVPIVECDVRGRSAARDVLVRLLEHAVSARSADSR
ncbi:ATP-binding protein, partial [Actinomadura sp. LOL_011]